MRSKRSLSTYLRSISLFFIIVFICNIKTTAQQNTLLTIGQVLTIPISCIKESSLPVHSYEFDFSKGEYIEILCEQQGSDARMSIISPEGKKIAIVDSYSGAYGPELWRGIAANTGKYKVLVEVLSSRGGDANYKISLPVKQSPNLTERKRAQAQELYSRAWLFKSGTQRDADEAYFLYEQATTLYREVGDGLGEAQSIASAAALGMPTLTKHLQTDLHRSALDIYRRIKEPNGEAIALHNLGDIYAENMRSSLAISSYKQAMKAYQAIGDWQGEALALNSLAMVYYRVNLPLDALSYLKQAAKVCQKGCDRSKEALVIKHIGEVYEGMGEENQAAEYYRQAREIVK